MSRGLCPFCGTSEIYYSKSNRNWKCGHCERSFPTPSYGPGKDFGKEDRLRGSALGDEHKPQLEKRGRKVFIKTHRKTKNLRPSKSVIKLGLTLAILTGFVGLIRYGYLLFTHKLEALPGSAYLIGGLILWVLLIKLLHSKYRWVGPSFKLTTSLVLAILLILAFAGVQPLAGYKDTVVTKIGIGIEEGKEVLVPTGPHGTYSQIGLLGTRTVTVDSKILTVVDPLFGKRVYNYGFKSGNWNWTSHGDYRSGLIELAYLTSTGWVVSQERFIYQVDIDALTLGEVTYYK